MGERADRLSMHATLFDDPAMVNRRLSDLLAVTPERIREATEAYLAPDNRVVLRYVPNEGAEPAA